VSRRPWYRSRCSVWRWPERIEVDSISIPTEPTGESSSARIEALILGHGCSSSVVGFAAATAVNERAHTTHVVAAERHQCHVPGIALTESANWPFASELCSPEPSAMRRSGAALVSSVMRLHPTLVAGFGQVQNTSTDDVTG